MKLEDYADTIALYESLPRPRSLTRDEEASLLAIVLGRLCDEEGQPLPLAGSAARSDLRALLNTRPPKPLPPELLEPLDRLLWADRVRTGIVLAQELPSIGSLFGATGDHSEDLCLWRGDITRLEVDAIVNAANSALLGCFSPLHSCIDNAIHSAAGPRLRDDCARIMALQGSEESPGNAKITRAYNLPSRFVLHTVGPVVGGDLTDGHRELLASSYESCLELAAETRRIESIAFCSISTGVFGFPADAASTIAVNSVSAWLDRNPGTFTRVVFDVFTEADHARYRQQLSN